MEQFLVGYGNDHNAFSSRELEWIGRALNWTTEAAESNNGRIQLLSPAQHYLDGRTAHGGPDCFRLLLPDCHAGDRMILLVIFMSVFITGVCAGSLFEYVTGFFRRRWRL